MLACEEARNHLRIGVRSVPSRRPAGMRPALPQLPRTGPATLLSRRVGAPGKMIFPARTVSKRGRCPSPDRSRSPGLDAAPLVPATLESKLSEKKDRGDRQWAESPLRTTTGGVSPVRSSAIVHQDLV